MSELKSLILAISDQASQFWKRLARFSGCFARVVIRNAYKELRIASALVLHAGLGWTQKRLGLEHVIWASALTFGVGVYASLQFLILAGFELARLVARECSDLARDRRRGYR